MSFEFCQCRFERVGSEVFKRGTRRRKPLLVVRMIEAVKMWLCFVEGQVADVAGVDGNVGYEVIVSMDSAFRHKFITGFSLGNLCGGFYLDREELAFFPNDKIEWETGASHNDETALAG
jgi:hypothetical protein